MQPHQEGKGYKSGPALLLPGLPSGRDGSWLSLADHPHIADDSELLGLFGDVAGITFLAQHGPSEGAQADHHDRTSRYLQDLEVRMAVCILCVLRDLQN